ncbi:hypothetical protein [Ralstonia sp.]|uniref:hypothetical protein n=1 Tax=Ralstonia sp. TaxID=54061 RepID=UPI00257F7580|nr:hypothetical protein [Ralstonia sp.]MBA4281096.1 hypothetical protein [Ralstonia sp.]
MALGIPIALPFRVHRAAFDPGTLFRNGEQGGWYDPSDMSTLFQDAAGTTPVTALGQPVGRINDKSGRGNHLTQTTAASRPLWQQDAAGAFHLAFDGVDDFLTIGTFNMSASDKVTVCAGLRKISATTAVAVELSAASTTNNGAFGIFAPDSAAQYTFASRGTLLAAASTVDAQFAAPHTGVVTGTGDIAADGCRLAIGGIQRGITGSDQGTGNYGAAHPLFVGLRGGTTLPFNGNLYGLVIRGTGATTTQIAALERYMARQTGIAL